MTVTGGTSLDLLTPIYAGTLVANQGVDPVIEALAPEHFFIPRLLISNDHGAVHPDGVDGTEVLISPRGIERAGERLALLEDF